MNPPTPNLSPGFRATLLVFTLSAIASSGAHAASITYLGAEPGSAGSGYVTQNWSNPGVAKTYDLSGDVYGTAGYYQIRPIAYPPGSTIYSAASAGNNLGITEGSNPTLYSAPAMLSSMTGGAGDYVNFNNYAIFRGPDGSTLYTQGGLSVAVNQGPYNTPSGANNGYFGEAFSFTMGTSATYRVGVAVDTVASGTYAPNYVSIYNNGTGSVYSESLTRDGTPDMTVFEINAAAGDSFTTALWQLSGTQSAAAFGLITFDVSSYNLDVTSGSQTNSSALGGSPAALLKTGAGTAVLTGASTFTGATTISNGAVQLGGSGTLAGGTYGGAVALATNSSSLAIATTANQTLSGVISGSGSLSKSSNGTLTLGGGNSYSGGTAISGGRVITTTNNALGDASGAITVSGGAYLDVRTNMTRTGSVTFDGGYLATSGGAPASLSKTGGSFVLSNAAEIVAELAGTAGLTSGGIGTSILWRSNSYTGATVVNAGTLRLDGSGALSTNTTLQVDSGAAFATTGTFLTSNNVTVAGLTGAGTVTGAAGTLTINKSTTASDVFSGKIQGGIGVTLAGATQLWFAGSNNYTGSTVVGGGNTVLNLVDGNGLGSTSAGTTVDSGSVLRIQGTNGGGSGITVAAEALTISGLGRAGSGGALRSVSGTNTWQGVVTLAADARIGSAANSLLALDVASGNAIEAANRNLEIEGAGHTSINDSISLGTGRLTKTGTGSLVLGASNTYSGGTLISQGVLQIGNGGAAGSVQGPITNNATLIYNRSDSVTQSGTISGTGGVTKLGNGTLTLSGVNTYTGATAVNAGSLVVDGSINIATTVQSGTTLGGSGSVASVTVQNGGTIAPGDSPGTLTITNGLTWAGGGNYNWQIFGVSGIAGQTNTWDLIDVTGGTWDINGLSSANKFNINLWSLSGLPDTTGAVAGFDAAQNYSWMILASGGLSGTFNTNLFNINTSAINGTGGFVGATGLFSLAVDGNNDLFLNYTGAGAAVPEPGTWAAGGLLLVLAAFARRRAKARTEKTA